MATALNAVCCFCRCFVVCWHALSNLQMSWQTASINSGRYSLPERIAFQKASSTWTQCLPQKVCTETSAGFILSLPLYVLQSTPLARSASPHSISAGFTKVSWRNAPCMNPDGFLKPVWSMVAWDHIKGFCKVCLRPSLTVLHFRAQHQRSQKAP